MSFKCIELEAYFFYELRYMQISKWASCVVTIFQMNELTNIEMDELRKDESQNGRTDEYRNGRTA